MRTGIEDAAERVEVVEQRTGVIDKEADFGDFSICRSDVFIPKDREVREHTRKVIALRPTGSAPWPLRRDAFDQRDLRPVMERSCDTAILEVVGAEEIRCVKVEGCLVALEDQLALNLCSGGDDERAGLSEPFEGLHD